MLRTFPFRCLVCFGAVAFPWAAVAATIDRTLTLQVFDVCNDSGLSCAALGPAGDNFWAAEVNRIWAQAGISVGFDFAGDIDSTQFGNIDDSSSTHAFQNLADSYGTMGPSSTTVDLFLVDTVNNGADYGEGWQGAGGLVIGVDTVLGYLGGNNGLGRIDTVAHELGHNLGLDPADDPEYDTATNDGHSDNPDELMASGSIRIVPLTSADIAPDGSDLDQISAFQVNVARQSSLLTDVSAPEPATFTLFAGGFLLIALRRRRG